MGRFLMISRMWLTLPAEYCTAQRPIAKPRLTAMLRPPSQELQAECLCLEAGPSTTGPLYEQGPHRPPIDWLIVSLCNSPAALPPDAIMPPSSHHKPLSARYRTATRPAAPPPPRCTSDTLVLVTYGPNNSKLKALGSKLCWEHQFKATPAGAAPAAQAAMWSVQVWRFMK